MTLVILASIIICGISVVIIDAALYRDNSKYYKLNEPDTIYHIIDIIFDLNISLHYFAIPFYVVLTLYAIYPFYAMFMSLYTKKLFNE